MKFSLARGIAASLAAIGLSLAAAAPAQAANVLLYDDFVYNGVDTWGSALAGNTVTRVDSDSAFNAAVAGSSFDLVVVQIDSTGHSLNLGSTLSGGKLIYGDWTAENDGILGVSQLAYNQSNLSIGAALSAGLSSANQTLVNPTYGIFSRDFSGGVELASLGGGEGIVLANGGNVLVNGFLGNTFANSADEVQLYRNEVGYLTSSVPEPGNLGLLAAGLALVGAVARRRRA